MVVEFKYFLFSPRTLGKWSNLTCAYFSNGWFNHQLEKYFVGLNLRQIFFGEEFMIIPSIFLKVRVDKSCNSLGAWNFWRFMAHFVYRTSPLFSEAKKARREASFWTLRFTTRSIETQVRRHPTPFWRRWGYTGAVHEHFQLVHRYGVWKIGVWRMREEWVQEEKYEWMFLSCCQSCFYEVV